MKNDGDEHGQDAEHGQEPRDGRLGVAQSRTARAIDGALRQLGVDVLDLDGRLVHQDADGQRQAAQRHQVDRLAGEPERDDGRHQRQRDVQSTTTSALRQSRRKSSIIRPTSTAPRAPSLTTPQHGARHVGRLVELEAHVDVAAAGPPACRAGPP